MNLNIRSTDALERKLETIKRMQPRHIDDFIPLLDMKEPILREITVMAAKEYDIPEKSRIYYLSRELQVMPFSEYSYRLYVIIIPTI